MNINEVSRGDYLREKSYEDSARVSQIDAFETGDGKDLMSSQNNDELVQGGVIVSKNKVKVADENNLFERIAKKTESIDGKSERKKIILTEQAKGRHRTDTKRKS